MDWHLIQERVEVASCYWDQDKLRPDEPLDSYADFTYFCNLQCIGNFAGSVVVAVV